MLISLLSLLFLTTSLSFNFKSKTLVPKSSRFLFNSIVDDSKLNIMVKRSIASIALITSLGTCYPQENLARPLFESTTLYTSSNDGLPSIGSPAPDFSLPSNINGGQKLSLNDLKGKRTVLYFYPGKNESKLIITCEYYS